MKIILASLLAMGLITNAAFAQAMEVREVTEKMSQGKQPALSINIPGADDKDVEKEWKKLVKDMGNKTSGSKKEMFTDNLLISSISTNTIDVYAAVDKSKSGTTFMVFFDLGGAFLNSKDHPEQYAAAAQFLRNFALGLARSAAEGELKDVENDLSKLEKEQRDLQKDQWKLEDTIKKAEETIAKARKDLEENKKDQEKNTKLLEEQKKKVSDAKSILDKIQ